MHWTNQERIELRKQIKAGTPLSDLKIEGRSAFAIRYKVYSMRFNFLRWKRKEISLLKRLIKEGKRPWEIEIPGRSKNAVRNKSIRLGYWMTRKRSIKPWTLKEISLLKRLVGSCGYTRRMLINNGYFPNRSKDSISQQIRRLRLIKK